MEVKRYYVFENNKDPKNGSRIVYRCTDYSLSSGTGDNLFNKLQGVQIGLAEVPVGLYLADRLGEVLMGVEFGATVFDKIIIPFEQRMVGITLTVEE